MLLSQSRFLIVRLLAIIILISIPVYALANSYPSKLFPKTETNIESKPDSKPENRERRINFEGKSTHSIRIPCSSSPRLPPSSSTQRRLSFPKWLASKHSHVHLLGSKEVSKLPNGQYKSVLPSISWFGMKLVPTFLHTISVEEMGIGMNMDNAHVASDYNDYENESEGDEGTPTFVKVVVTIEDSDVDISEGSELGGFVEKMMKSCTFKGGNEMICIAEKRYSDEDGKGGQQQKYFYRDEMEGEDVWIVSSKLTLKLTLPLASRLMILPPGFNTIGSLIVKRTVERRARENLTQLVEEYHAFQNGLLE